MKVFTKEGSEIADYLSVQVPLVGDLIVVTNPNQETMTLEAKTTYEVTRRIWVLFGNESLKDVQIHVRKYEPIN